MPSLFLSSRSPLSSCSYQPPSFFNHLNLSLFFLISNNPRKLVFGDNDIRVINFSSFTNEYLFLNLSCIAFLSNYHGLPKSKCLICIGTKSHKILLLYLLIKKGDQNLFVYPYFPTLIQQPKLIRSIKFFSIQIQLINKYS